ncbi:hypothetical protein HPO96_14235 [Kribbella sandramycini]|uniref:FtsX-like permease family protein n=1 Tax=Kribbella sandramycini TaxID=60450 RepID=A0A7Y4NYX0_9ACTN|nr:FtsX-like permease family protein [Kribbella sandramycini]MBB6565133.1 hypothetical protein [Kribbella sandramycini]NOL41402.1 hypothetical protein [Kribbella sandramycini]
MTVETMLQLARSRTPADRSRIRLTVAALSLSGAFLLGALRVLSLGGGTMSADVYSNYVAEPGLRIGLSAILVLLAALTAGLAVQAFRLGTAARERRLTALRLAGASDKQVRRLSATDAATAGLAGGLIAGPVYLALSLLLGALPRVARILPGVQLLDLAAWLAVIVVTTAGGVLLAVLLHRDDLEPRAEHPPVRPGLPKLVVGVVLTVIGVVAAPWVGLIAAAMGLIGVALIAHSTSAVWVQAVGRRLSSSGDPVQLLAGSRLIAEGRASARLGALLGFCGLLVGATLNAMTAVIRSDRSIDDLQFYGTGFGFAALALLLVAGTVLAALVVGVADQLVDQRRQLASLTAFGVDVPFLRRVVQRQLALVAAPALGIGMAAGMLISLGRLIGGTREPYDPVYIPLAVALLVIGGLLALGGAALAGLFLRNQLKDALHPENLRAA